MPYVEFALHSQHETSSDSGIQFISDIADLENQPRKRLRYLSLVSRNSRNMDENWETNILQRNGLSSKRLKLDQCEN